MPVDGGSLLLRTLRLVAADSAELGPRWAGVPMEPMQELVQLERCGTWLNRRLKDLGLESVLPPPLAERLAQQARAGAARTLLIQARAMELARWLTAHGVPFVFIKGIARQLLAGRIPYIDARVTTDVDLLLLSGDAERVWDALRATGYAPAAPPELRPAGHYHLLPLAERDGVAVELHTSVANHLGAAEAWRRCMEGAVFLECEGQTLMVPSAGELLWQSVTHAEADESAGYDLRHFQDAAVLLADGKVDTTPLAERLLLPEIRDHRRMARWLAAAAWLGGREASFAVDDGAGRFDLERALRWRYTAVSGSIGRPRLMEKLVDEATRAEAGLPLGLCAEGTPLAGRMRRRMATTGARSLYLVWRGLQR